jgi:hypothetical protein
MLRAIKTALMGYSYCKEHKDEKIVKQAASFEKRLKIMRYFLCASTIFVQNRKSEYLLKDVKELYRLYFGWAGLRIFALSALIVLLSLKEYLRCRISGDKINPKTTCTVYNVIKTGHIPEKIKTETVCLPTKIMPGFVE